MYSTCTVQYIIATYSIIPKPSLIHVETMFMWFLKREQKLLSLGNNWATIGSMFLKEYYFAIIILFYEKFEIYRNFIYVRNLQIYIIKQLDNLARLISWVRYRAVKRGEGQGNLTKRASYTMGPLRSLVLLKGTTILAKIAFQSGHDFFASKEPPPDHFAPGLQSSLCRPG